VFDGISEQANDLVSLAQNHSIQTSNTKIITITSGKGGVGKSTFTSNIAYLLSKRGKKIAIFDADMGLANLQVLFDIKPNYTFHDYLDGKCEIEDILSETGINNISLIAGKSGHQYVQSHSNMLYSNLVAKIVALNKFDVLLVDTGAGINGSVQEFLEMTDNIIALTTTDPSALTDVYALLKMLSLKKERLFLCFNYTSKYETGEVITQSLKKLAIKNKLNRKFMVQYIGNVSEERGIAISGRLRKLFTKELEKEQSTRQLQIVVNNLLELID
jgi:flagellar biosynthesis protein FlhG